MGNYVYTTSVPAGITKAEYKAHALVTHDEDDAQIELVILAVTRQLQTYTNRAIKTQSLVYSTDQLKDFVSLPLSPAVSITNIKYYDSNGDLQTMLAGTDYKLISGVEPSQVKFINKFPLEVRPDAVQITYEAGSATVPEDIKTALFLLCSHFMENKGLVSYASQTFEVPRTMLLFIDSLRVRFLN